MCDDTTVLLRRDLRQGIVYSHGGREYYSLEALRSHMEDVKHPIITPCFTASGSVYQELSGLARQVEAMARSEQTFK